MIREVKTEDLDQMLELYLFLHEEVKPENNRHLRDVWNEIIED